MRENKIKQLGYLPFMLLAGVIFLVSYALNANDAQARDRLQTNGGLHWHHLSTAKGDLDIPSTSDQQVLTLVLDIDKDGVNDFVIGSRRPPGPSMLWYQRTDNGWNRYVIEDKVLGLEAGGAFYDIDGDGDLDVVAGNNNQGKEIWWWENPYPNYSPSTNWQRHTIKSSGGNKHHDMLFGDFDGDGQAEFAYWNQGVKSLFIVEIPSNPKGPQQWPDATSIFNASSNNSEGLVAADIDGDGTLDLVGGGYWFKHNGGTNYKANLIETGSYMRVAVGQLVPGGRPEIVQIPGDANGKGRWFQWDSDASKWVGKDLPLGTIKQGHSLELGDVNNDGHLDIFIGEMRFPDNNNKSNPQARTVILLGDSQGNFTVETVATGYGHHESRLADLDGDGDLDILGKPYLWDSPRLDIWLNLMGETPVNTPTATTPGGSCKPFGDWQTHIIDNQRPYRAVFIDSADIDGDGNDDIITGAWWYRNPGTPGGNWQRKEIGAPMAQMAAVYDFDGDGDFDILGTVWDGKNANQMNKGSEFVWARNNGSGQFTILDNVANGSGDFLQGVAVASLSSGTQEVILSWHQLQSPIQSLTVPTNPSTDQWPIRTFSSLTQGEDLSIGDIDRDGDLDILLGTVWLRNNGGSWSNHTTSNTSDKPDRNRLADLNGDGRLDAVVGYETTNSSAIRLAWYEAPANPTQGWTERIIDTIVAPMSLDVGDIDGDGDIDVVAGEHHKKKPAQGRVFVYENNGNGTFQRHAVATGHEHHDGTQLVDIDGDGDLDIISIGWTHDTVLLYENAGCSKPPPTNTPTATGTPTATSTPTPDTTETPTATPTDELDPPSPTATPTNEPDPPSPTPSPTDEPVPPSPTPSPTDEPVPPSPTPSPTDEPVPPTATATATPSPPSPAHGGELYYLSSTAKGTVDGIAFSSEDILVFDSRDESWALYFDGSDVGLDKNNIDAFFLRANGQMIISLKKAGNLPGLGKVESSDLLLFTPTSTGENTAGSWSLLFDGSDVELTTNPENINTVMELPDGRLIISTNGKVKVTGLTANKWDLLLFTPDELGINTRGTWSLYAAGAGLGLDTNTEGIFGASLVDDNQLYVKTQAAFKLGYLNGKKWDIFRCTLSGSGLDATCDPRADIAWSGKLYDFTKPIDALHVVRAP